MLRKWGMPHHYYWLSAAGDLNSCWCYTWWWFLLTMMTRPEQLYLDTTCWLSTSSRVVAVSVCWCGITQVLRLTPPSSSSGLYPRLNIEPPPSSTAESGDPNSSLLLLLRSNQQQSIFHTRPKLTLKNPQKRGLEKLVLTRWLALLGAYPAQLFSAILGQDGTQLSPNVCLTFFSS